MIDHLVLRRSLLSACAVLLTGCAQLSPVATDARTAKSVFDGGGYPVAVCNADYSGRSASCTVSGSGPNRIVRANVISNGILYVGGALLIGGDGRIQAAGCEVPAAPAITFDCPGALASAGFMNLHEHIDYSYQQPPRPPALKWEHRHEWRKLSDEERGFAGNAPKDEQVRAEVSERAMLRHALSGSTAVSGAKTYRAFLRNLGLEDGGPLAMPLGRRVVDDTFPLNDGGSKEWPKAPCDAAQIAGIKLRALPEHPYVPHVGEGTNDGARHEVDCMLDAVRAKATPNAFIHGVAITDAQIARLKEQRVAVVLSPRSNFQLYGKTAPLAKLKQAGVTLAMGTDWSPSGSLTQLDEMRCLARHNRDRLQGLFSWADLHRMMTENGAQAVGLQGQVGALAVGELADLVLLDTGGRRSLGEVLERSALAETVAVFVGGRAASFPRAWEGKLAQLENCSPDPRDLCGQQRTVCGVNPARGLDRLLGQAAYTIDDARICRPQPTDDCVER
ncbi:MAG TPA: amidohydrolase family protein [Paucimonas sp.]|nr:amidohydrolase family protein [Paucimonas sp.]